MRQLSVPARLVVATVNLFALVILISSLPALEMPDAQSWLVAALVFLFALLTEFLNVPLRRGGEFSVSTIAHVAGALLLPAPTVVVLSALAVLCQQVITRRPWYKVAFNTASVIVTVAATCSSTRLLGHPLELVERNPGLSVVSMFVVALSYYLATSTVLALLVSAIRSQPFDQIFWVHLRTAGLAELSTAVIGGLVAFVWHQAPWWTVVTLFPAVIAYLTRKYVHVLSTRADELAASEQRLHLAMEAGNMGTWDWQLQTGEMSCSASCLVIHGTSPESFDRTFQAFIRTIHPEDRDAVSRKMMAAAEQERLHLEYRVLLPDGSVRWVEARGRAFTDENGKVVSVIGVCMDTTQVRHVLEALGESNRRLEETLGELRQAQLQVIQQERLHALGQMASGIAHDFNNCLSPILGFSELILVRPEVLDDKERARRYIEAINTAANDAANLVARLREFYRLRQSSSMLESVNLNGLVEQAVVLTQPRWRDQALASGITITVETRLGRIPPIAGNESELREVLTNLIFNSIDALPHGGKITLVTRTEGQHVILEVRDTGTGMTEEVRKRCLEPFFSTKGERGTGLGLSMVYGIVQRHSGSIEIHSAPGKGTTVRIRLLAGARHNGTSTKHSSQGLDRRLRVLLVDDDPIVLEHLAECLLSEGCQVERAANGREGIEKFRVGTFDLVVTDLAMPIMNGTQLAEAIKQLSPHTPVITITGFGDLITPSGKRSPCTDMVLEKPVRLDELRRAVVHLTSK